MREVFDISDASKAGLAAGLLTVISSGSLLLAGALSLGKLALLTIAVFAVLFLVVWGALNLWNHLQNQKSSKDERELLISDDADEVDAPGTTAEERASSKHVQNQFNKGYKRYCESHKKTKAVPWFLVMGGSGSGKTFALRNSGLEWDQDLKELNQGKSGTKTFDWWFHSDAIFLDTAGRYVELRLNGQEEEDSENFDDRLQQLQTLLRNVRKKRQPCPINGLILTVSSVDLQAKSEEQLQEDANRVRRTLKLVSGTLDVHFPVVVLVTKCDRIAGFRDYFGDIENDHSLRHQMVGWSGPGRISELKQTISEELLKEGLLTVARDLGRRRWRTLFSRELAGGHNRAQVASGVYVYPDRLEQEIVPRLTGYILRIFSGYAKPPFLRGVFFTSAVTDGCELDQRLADIRAQLTDERRERQGRQGAPSPFARNISFFIKDTLVRKLFLEQFLVTRYSDVVVYLRRLHWTLAAAVFCVLVICGLFAYSQAKQFRASAGKEEKIWSYVASRWTNEQPNTHLEILSSKGAESGYSYSGAKGLGQYGGGPAERRLQALRDLAGGIHANEINVPWLYRTLWNINVQTENRQDAWSRLVEVSLLGPLSNAVTATLRKTDEAPEKLVPLITNVVPLLSGERGTNVPEQLVNVLRSVVVDSDSQGDIDTDRPALLEVFKVYVNKSSNASALRVDGSVLLSAINRSSEPANWTSLKGAIYNLSQESVAWRQLTLTESNLYREIGELRATAASNRDLVSALQSISNRYASFSSSYNRAPTSQSVVIDAASAFQRATEAVASMAEVLNRHHSNGTQGINNVTKRFSDLLDPATNSLNREVQRHRGEKNGYTERRRILDGAILSLSANSAAETNGGRKLDEFSGQEEFTNAIASLDAFRRKMIQRRIELKGSNTLANIPWPVGKLGNPILDKSKLEEVTNSLITLKANIEAAGMTNTKMYSNVLVYLERSQFLTEDIGLSLVRGTDTKNLVLTDANWENYRPSERSAKGLNYIKIVNNNDLAVVRFEEKTKHLGSVPVSLQKCIVRLQKRETEFGGPEAWFPTRTEPWGLVKLWEVPENTGDMAVLKTTNKFERVVWFSVGGETVAILLRAKVALAPLPLH